MQVKVELLVWTMDDEDERDIRRIVREAMRMQLNDFRILSVEAEE